ncbi:MAG: peptidoglycan bridge formation glycyltransferase FemA/FemB family protein [Microbacteriaceae bacterium]|nr:peptidoglycan bridge formation glycyltransferase FemA/FemB family protein [Microbacteriaceae bacterium]
MNINCRFATAEEIADWDNLVTQNPDGGSYHITKAIIAARQHLGSSPKYLVFSNKGGAASKTVAVAFEHKIPLLGKHWHIARGPFVTGQADFEAHIAALRQFIAKNKLGVFHILVEPPLVTVDEKISKEPLAKPLLAPDLTAWREVFYSNSDTVIVDIDKSDEELLASFGKSTRYEIRQFLKTEPVLKEYPATSETFDTMRKLNMLVGGGNKNVELRPTPYLDTLWTEATKTGNSAFFVYETDGKPAVIAWIYIVGDNAYYVYGGSERPLTVRGMSHALQFEAMKWARDKGAKTYNLLGIAPASAKSDDDHPGYSLSRFKLGFGGRTTYTGAYDIPVNSWKSKIWLKIGERLYAMICYKLKSDLSIY